MLNPQDMEKLKSVSLGEEKADLVITGGDLVNVYSRELLPNHSVAIKGSWIAYVGPDARHAVGPETRVIDASGKVFGPGFVDGHAHMAHYGAPNEFLSYAIKSGATTIITELLELTFSLGYAGLVKLLDSLNNQPIKVFATVPPSITLSRGARKRAPSIEQLIELLRRDEIVGVGEGFWQEVIRGETKFPALAAEALRLGKTVEGHAAGCRANKLAAYLDYGVSSCHESISLEEVLEKLRLGVFVMIREGSVRKELEAIAEIRNMPLDFRRLALVSDGVDPRELTQKGYMNALVQKAIDLGIDPILAFQMASLNPAEHFGLDSVLGGIAPGKYADIVIIPDIRNIEPQHVVSKGQVVLQDGELQVKPHQIILPQGDLKGIRVSTSDFAIRTQRGGLINARVIDQVTELVTREAFVEICPHNGELKADPEHDLLKASVISCEGRTFTGLIRGLGLKAGAMATSGSWETFAIVVVGAGEEDVARAANRVCELGGGIVLCAHGEIQAELELPIGGLISSLTIEETAQKLEAIQDKAEKLGFRFPDAPLTLATLSSPAIPFLRISEDGIFDLRKGRVVKLIVD